LVLSFLNFQFKNHLSEEQSSSEGSPRAFGPRGFLLRAFGPVGEDSA